ncbi:glycosyl transferase [Jeotgalibacillus sp. S-D1]|uniref:glycosyltransferase family 32 protein n=1 Tax=Jeotgalibacillus sp. S-D1 TaxID=2552189 RepID=UPI00105930E3|nr:glycosyltransferase [Jeotgalibacillus sp. S-D1]TDL31817.1 glycosyl transferase [Jeotgalibacillus sp. S-D1]
MTTIPKRIHYCWFGGKEKPEQIKKCMNSWRVHLSEYEIIEWNESNFDMNSNPYIKEAYENSKFAFVSDFVRVHALYTEGGIYLDTDVEVFKPFDDLLHHESFWGFEQEDFIATSTIGAAKGNKLIKVFLDSYQNKNFLKEDGSLNEETNVAIVTKIVSNYGVIMNGDFQEVEEIGAFYPQVFFSPYDYINCRNFKTEASYAMHHYYKSWLSPKAKLKSRIKETTAKLIGGENIYKIRNLVSIARRLL